MPTDVKLPQMGESIYEGTITKWLKKEGDFVKKDEALYELSTDKVDSEIPSPVTGKLLRIVVGPGKKVPIHTVIAHVEEGADGGARSAPAPAPAPTPVAKPSPETRPTAVVAPVAARVKTDGDERMFASPLVRKIAKDEGVDLSQVSGTGPGGRITKEDIVAHLDRTRGGTQVARPAPVDIPTRIAPVPPAPAPAAPAPAPLAPPPPKWGTGRTHVEPMSPMRQKIAEHMINSRRTSAHVNSIFEIDLTRIVKLREQEKEDFETVTGAKLTFTPFFAMAAVLALKEFPVINASVDGTNIVYKRDIHLGMAVALPDGLIVPVVHNAEEKSFLGLTRSIADVAERARTKKLKVEEVQGGTFTITNPGQFGNLFGLPIINQPQVAIMGIGGIEKRPVVVDDAIAIRSMVYVSMSYDHRIVDGAVADQFLARVKKTLQEWNLPIR